VDFILTTEAIKEGFENLNHHPTTIIYTTPDFPEPLATGWYECHPFVHQTWRIQTSIVYWTGANPNITMVVDRFKEIENLNPTVLGVANFIERRF
jgi:hypothetical protein